MEELLHFFSNLCGSGWTLNASTYYEFLFIVDFCLHSNSFAGVGHKFVISTDLSQLFAILSQTDDT